MPHNLSLLGRNPNNQNRRSAFNFKLHKDMQSLDSDLSGIAGEDDNVVLYTKYIPQEALSLSGIGKKKFWDKVKSIIPKLIPIPKSTLRKMFLRMVEKNRTGIATKLARTWKVDKAAVIARWKEFKGTEPELKAAIIKGSGQSIAQEEGGDGKGIDWSVVLKIALPIILAFTDLFKKKKTETEAEAADFENEFDNTVPEEAPVRAALSFFTLGGAMFKFIFLQMVFPFFATGLAWTLFAVALTAYYFLIVKKIKIFSWMKMKLKSFKNRRQYVN